MADTTTYNLAPVYHIPFRDSLGAFAANGTVETFKSTSHITQLAVYEDEDGAVPFANPIVLNAAGIVADLFGAPKPIYWSSAEDYYIEVRDSGGALIQTIDNYNSPFAHQKKPVLDEDGLRNYIFNPQFRELNLDKAQYEDADLPASETLIAREGWFFTRDTTNSSNEINFTDFTLGQTDVPFNPKYYLNFECTGTGAETEKDIIVDIGDVLSFANQELSFAFYGQSSTSSTISLVLYQDFGTGGSAEVQTIVDTFSLGTSWSQFDKTFTVPDISGKTLGTAGTDKCRLGLRMPLNEISNIGLTNVQLNDGDLLLEFDYKTSIQEKSNSNSYELPTPTDADAYKSITLDSDNTTYLWASNPPIGFVGDFAGLTAPSGWLECDHGSYDGYEGTTYNNLWSVIKNIYGYGDDGFAGFEETENIYIFNVKKDTNVTNIADGNTGFTFETVHGGGDLDFYTQNQYDFLGTSTVLNGSFFRVENKNNGVVTVSSAGTSGFTINTVQVGTAVLPEITDIEPLAAAGLAGLYFLISSSTTDYYVWFEVDGVGADPAVGGRTGVKIAVAAGSSKVEMRAYIYWVLGGVEHSKIVCNAASTLSAGDYFLIYNSADTIAFWYRVDGAGSEPSAGTIKIPIDVNSSDTATQVADKTNKNGLKSFQFNVPDLRGMFTRGWNHGKTSPAGDPGAGSRYERLDLAVAGDNVGTLQMDEFRSHQHSLPVNAGKSGGSEQALATTGASNITGATGGNETRAVNIYMMKIIKH